MPTHSRLWVFRFPVERSAAKLDGLWDYGNKAWSGLVKGYYDRRYQLYADHKLAALKRGAAGMSDEFDADTFITSVMQAAHDFGLVTGADLPKAASGDALAIGKELYAKYPPSGAVVA